MSRLYRPDGSLAPCPSCRRLHDRWQVPGGTANPDYGRRACGWVVRTACEATAWTGGTQVVKYLCGAEAPRDLVEATERVRTGELAPLIDPEPWAVLEAA